MWHLDEQPLPPGPMKLPAEAWARFPNEFDLKYLAYLEAREEFANKIREQWEAQQRQRPIPLTKYEDGDYTFTMSGSPYPVDKSLYGWLLANTEKKDHRAFIALTELIAARQSMAKQPA